jgi:hypothetical protein
MGSGAITGLEGSIAWAHYTAAQLEGYTVTRTDTRWTLSATIVLSDAFKLAQRPLIFVAPHAHGEWRWPILSLDVVAQTLTATLGPPDP